MGKVDPGEKNPFRNVKGPGHRELQPEVRMSVEFLRSLKGQNTQKK